MTPTQWQELHRLLTKACTEANWYAIDQACGVGTMRRIREIADATCKIAWPDGECPLKYVP